MKNENEKCGANKVPTLSWKPFPGFKLGRSPQRIWGKMCLFDDG